MAQDTRNLVDEFVKAGQELAVDLADSPNVREVLLNYTKYLLGEKPHGYTHLATFLDWYGSMYVLPKVTDEILKDKKYEQIIEMGPGTGWLINALGPWARLRYALDKRDNLLHRTRDVTFLQHDLEEMPVSPVKITGNPLHTLIIACQFLHCVENPGDVIRRNRAQWLVIETDSRWWLKQMELFGANPIPKQDLDMMFYDAGYMFELSMVEYPFYYKLWAPRENTFRSSLT